MLKSEVLRKESVMEHAENYWKSFDGINLYSQTWFATNKQRAIINLIHGINEYSGRYALWAQQLAEQGFTVRSFDLRCHGRSEGRRGYCSSYSKLLKDLELFMEQGRNEFPNQPIFLYGQSFGGNLAINYAIQQNLNINGLIVTSPWLEPVKKYSRFQVILASLVSNFLPGLLLNNGMKAEDLSRDLRTVYNYSNDPLVHNKISVNLALQIIEAGRRASMSIYKINSPLLVMHGNSDSITSCKASKNFVRNASERTTFIEWEGGYHELHNDLNHEKVFESLVSWLNKYTG